MILLDTHALVWWVSEDPALPTKVRRRLSAAMSAREVVYVSSITVWEIAMLVARGRLELRIPVADWIAAVESLPFLRFVPVDNRIAANAVALAGFPHPDPADRMIAATALGMGATLVTGDRKLRGYRPLTSWWA